MPGAVMELLVTLVAKKGFNHDSCTLVYRHGAMEGESMQSQHPKSHLVQFMLAERVKHMHLLHALAASLSSWGDGRLAKHMHLLHVTCSSPIVMGRLKASTSPIVMGRLKVRVSKCSIRY